MQLLTEIGARVFDDDRATIGINNFLESRKDDASDGGEVSGLLRAWPPGIWAWVECLYNFSALRWLARSLFRVAGHGR
jgi:hypothetical protein